MKDDGRHASHRFGWGWALTDEEYDAEYERAMKAGEIVFYERPIRLITRDPR